MPSVAMEIRELQECLDEMMADLPSGSSTTRSSREPSEPDRQNARTLLTEDYIATLAMLDQTYSAKANSATDPARLKTPKEKAPEVFVISTPPALDSRAMANLRDNDELRSESWFETPDMQRRQQDQAKTLADSVQAAITSGGSGSASEVSASDIAGLRATPLSPASSVRGEVVFQPVIPGRVAPSPSKGSRCAAPPATPSGSKRPWPVRPSPRGDVDSGLSSGQTSSQSTSAGIGETTNFMQDLSTPARPVVPALKTPLPSGADSSMSTARPIEDAETVGTDRHHMSSPSCGSRSDLAASCTEAVAALQAQVQKLEKTQAKLDERLKRITDGEKHARLRAVEARQDCMDSRIFEICGRLPDLQDLQQADSVPCVSSTVAAHELCTAWSERISALELSQKTMAEAVRRALQTAIAAQEEATMVSAAQAAQADESASDPLDVLRRLDEHERRIATLDAVTAVTSLELRAAPRIAAEPAGVAQHNEAIGKETEELPVVVIPKQLDVTNMHELLDDACSADEQDWELFAQNLEAQVLKSTAEVRTQLESLQDVVDQKVLLKLWELGRQVPEVSQNMERLAGQCADFFAKVEAHEVRLSLMVTTQEMQDQRVQALSERCERTHAVSLDLDTQTAARSRKRQSEALEGRVEAHAQALEELRGSFRELKARVQVRGIGLPSTPGTPQLSQPGTPRRRVVSPPRSLCAGAAIGRPAPPIVTKPMAIALPSTGQSITDNQSQRSHSQAMCFLPVPPDMQVLPVPASSGCTFSQMHSEESESADAQPCTSQ